ncbi:MAG: FMN-binding protein [Propionibacteriaceae bacterium]|jgi:major membrane immunogen (membrane-anchored lipoprotein)|nr:FMN-binding protein [Propionibacteriaceae bacterium]
MNPRRALPLTLIALLAACSGPTLDKTLPLADGTFEATSAPDEEGATGHITVTVESGRVVAATFAVIGQDGQPKDDTYGLDSQGNIANQDYYDQAQRAVEAFPVYSRQLVEVGYPQDVDSISGATWAHDQFVEAATAALRQSQEAAS